MPEESMVIGYADGVGIVVTSMTEEDLQYKTKAATEAVTN